MKAYYDERDCGHCPFAQRCNRSNVVGGGRSMFSVVLCFSAWKDLVIDGEAAKRRAKELENVRKAEEEEARRATEFGEKWHHLPYGDCTGILDDGTKVGVISFSVRAEKVLEEKKVRTIGQLLDLDMRGVSVMRNVGAKTVEELEEVRNEIRVFRKAYEKGVRP